MDELRAALNENQRNLVLLHDLIECLGQILLAAHIGVRILDMNDEITISNAVSLAGM